MKRFLRDHQVGEMFTGFCVLRSKDLRSKRDGGTYLALEFGDRSGRLSGMIWEDAERLYHELEVGGIIKLQGRIEQYRDSLQVGVKKLRRATSEDDVDATDLLPVSPDDPEESMGRLNNIVATIGNPFLRGLLENILEDEKITAAFKRAPGGKLWHHNRLGGLLEHTLGVCTICRFLSRMYPEIDKDLFVAGAILHDIGKIEEFRYDTLIDYTDRGRLVGHITLGAQLVSERASRIEEFPPDLLDRITHLILSHQAEFGSPVLPATREAFLLHYADQIDSKMDALWRIEGDLQEGERWIFVRLLDRYINFGEDEPEEDS